MSAWVAFAVVALLAAVALQAATGFGFALLAGPSLYAVMSPAHAVALLLILGLCVNVLVLGGERRRLEVDWRGLKPALLASVPGLPLGAVLVRVLPADALRVGIGAIVVVLVAQRLLRRAPTPGRPPPGRAAAVAAGFSAGVLTTSTTTNGPPLALWLGGRGLPPAVVRDTVSAAFLVLDMVGVASCWPWSGRSERSPRRSGCRRSCPWCSQATSPAAGSSGACRRTATTRSCSPRSPPRES